MRLRVYQMLILLAYALLIFLVGNMIVGIFWYGYTSADILTEVLIASIGASILHRISHSWFIIGV